MGLSASCKYDVQGGQSDERSWARSEGDLGMDLGTWILASCKGLRVLG